MAQPEGIGSEMDGPRRHDTQVLLAEYAALRAEIERRAGIQWNIFALQVGSAGAIASLAISTEANLNLLLLIPLSSYMLGGRYILHDYHIKVIQKYIRTSLSQRLNNDLQWEGWKAHEISVAPDRSRWYTASGWNLLHPTRLAFAGVAALALASAIAGTLYLWSSEKPTWPLVLAVGLGWVLDLIAIGRLHVSFGHAGKDLPDLTLPLVKRDASHSKARRHLCHQIVRVRHLRRRP
jgi:hypothetical protein